MILSYFGFKGRERLPDKPYSLKTFKEDFPDIDIEGYDKINNEHIFFIEKDDINLCFITSQPFKERRYHLNTDNLLVEVTFGDKKALIEIEPDFSYIYNIYKVSDYEINGIYTIVRKSTKISGLNVSVNKLKAFIKKNYKKGVVLTWKK